MSELQQPSHTVQAQQEQAEVQAEAGMGLKPKAQQEQMLAKSLDLHCLADFAIYPDMSCQRSLSTCVNEIEKVLQDYGIAYKVHRHGTSLQGSVACVMEALEACHAAVHQKCGAIRLCSNIRLETKLGKFKEEELTMLGKKDA